MKTLKDSEAVKYPQCPKCKTLIMNCQRIQNELKLITRKVDNVKKHIFDNY